MESPVEPCRQSNRTEGWDLVLAAADEATHRALVPLLRLGGFAVRTVRCRGEALAAVEASLPDVLITEAELPDGTGYGVVRTMRELPRGDLPAVLVLGARGGGCNHAAAIYSGVDVVLDHPVDWGVLARVLARVLAARPAAPYRVGRRRDPQRFPGAAHGEPAAPAAVGRGAVGRTTRTRLGPSDKGFRLRLMNPPAAG